MTQAEALRAAKNSPAAPLGEVLLFFPLFFFSPCKRDISAKPNTAEPALPPAPHPTGIAAPFTWPRARPAAAGAPQPLLGSFFVVPDINTPKSPFPAIEGALPRAAGTGIKIV